MSSKKDISQKKTTQSEIKSIPSQTREAKSEKYSPPRPIPTFKDRPKPKLPSSQPSKQEPAPSPTPSKKD
jgi:hypothetical protein